MRYISRYIPFCKTNDIHIHLKVETISIGSTVNIPYGFADSSSHANIRRIDSILLRNDIEKVLISGDYVEFKCKDLQQFDGEVATEPHSSFSKSKSWVEPTISRVIEGTLRIPNLKDEPVQIQKAQHIPQIRPIIIPEEPTNQTPSCEPPSIPKNYPADFSTAISLDPDGMLSSESRNNFRDISKRFQSIVNPNFGVYNDKSGPICADINLDPVEPPTQKESFCFIIRKTYNNFRRKLINLRSWEFSRNLKMWALTSNLFLLASS